MDKQASTGFKDLVQRKLQFVVDELKKVVGNGAIELLKMNKGKIGRPYRYSETEIVNASAFKSLMRQGFRQTAVLIKGLAGSCASYSQLCRRLASAGIKWLINRTKRKGRYLAIDGTGISTHYRGDYRSGKYSIRQPFYKFHALEDAETGELVNYRLTSDRIGDNGKFLAIVREAARRGDIVYADGAYDAKDNFSFLEKRGIRSGIKIRQTASPTAPGCLPRKKAVMEQFSLLPHGHLERKHPLAEKGRMFFSETERMKYWQQRWKDKVGYGRRTSVERSYSTFKALFGGYASSRKWKSLRKEMLIKCLTYNKLLEIR